VIVAVAIADFASFRKMVVDLKRPQIPHSLPLKL
jgi:hypothetical protein